MNVNLWFARNKDDEIMLITDINESNRSEKYTCPVCNSEVIPKAIGEECVVSKIFAKHFLKQLDIKQSI
jgi:competence CoiA-like predicted nuclease